MEGGIGKQHFKIAVIGSDLTTLGFKLAGVTKSYSPEDGQQTETLLRELLQKEDIGIIVITTRMVKTVRDRRLQEAITSSIMPLIVEVPDYSDEGAQEDTLRRLIIRAIGIDIEKNA